LIRDVPSPSLSVVSFSVRLVLCSSRSRQSVVLSVSVLMPWTWSRSQGSLSWIFFQQIIFLDCFLSIHLTRFFMRYFQAIRFFHVLLTPNLSYDDCEWDRDRDRDRDDRDRDNWDWYSRFGFGLATSLVSFEQYFWSLFVCINKNSVYPSIIKKD